MGWDEWHRISVVPNSDGNLNKEVGSRKGFKFGRDQGTLTG